MDGFSINTDEVAAFSIGTNGYILGSNFFTSFDTKTKTFTSLSSFPSGSLLHAFAANSKGIAIMASGDPYDNNVWEFDPSTFKWTQKSNCPYFIPYGSFTFTIGSKAYVGGHSTHEFVSYDNSTDTWTKLADYPGFNGEGAATAVIDGIGYCFQGGFSPIVMDDYDYVAENEFNGNWKYDPASDKWTKLADGPDLIKDRVFAMIVTVGDKIYFGAGVSSMFTSPQYLDFMYSYSTATDTWTKSLLLSDPYEFNESEYGYTFIVGDKGYMLTRNKKMYIFKPNGD
jgi:hypothetical protein